MVQVYISGMTFKFELDDTYRDKLTFGAVVEAMMKDRGDLFNKYGFFSR